MRAYLIIAMFLLSQPVSALTGDEVLGQWLTPEGKSKVEIFPCAEHYCGRIVWLKEPRFPEDDPQAGETKIDRNNPNPALHKRPILGLQLMHGFVYDGEGKWHKGQIYDPNNGKTYSCKMQLSDANTLEVRGFIGISLLGRTSIWRR